MRPNKPIILVAFALIAYSICGCRTRPAVLSPPQHMFQEEMVALEDYLNESRHPSLIFIKEHVESVQERLRRAGAVVLVISSDRAQISDEGVFDSVSKQMGAKVDIRVINEEARLLRATQAYGLNNLGIDCIVGLNITFSRGDSFSKSYFLKHRNGTIEIVEKTTRHVD